MLGLLGVGLYGLLISRNMIKIVIALQILVKAAILALVAAGQASGQMNLAQSLAVTVIVADTTVAVVGLALGVQVRAAFRHARCERVIQAQRVRYDQRADRAHHRSAMARRVEHPIDRRPTTAGAERPGGLVRGGCGSRCARSAAFGDEFSHAARGNGGRAGRSHLRATTALVSS